LCWHLAVMIPRLPLSSKERQLATSLLSSYLEDRSSIVKTSALQGLADLTMNDPSNRPGVIELLRQATRSGTPAMKARSRKLLRHLEHILNHNRGKLSRRLRERRSGTVGYWRCATGGRIPQFADSLLDGLVCLTQYQRQLTTIFI
jgi:hypothetical protein